jgi:hypothetical protein
MMRNEEWGWIDIKDDLILTAHCGSGRGHC